MGEAVTCSISAVNGHRLLFQNCSADAGFGYRPVIRVMEMVMESCKINTHNVEMPGARHHGSLGWLGVRRFGID